MGGRTSPGYGVAMRVGGGGDPHVMMALQIVGEEAGRGRGCRGRGRGRGVAPALCLAHDLAPAHARVEDQKSCSQQRQARWIFVT